MKTALLSVLATLAAASAPAQGPDVPRGVTHARIEGELDAGTLAHLHRAVEEAAAAGNRLVIELDTPGGEIGLMVRLKDEIMQAARRDVPVAGWVNTRAWSAGALLALACEDLFLRADASIGSAQPIQITPLGVRAVSPDTKVEEKLDSTLRATFRATAEARGRPPLLAEAMIDPGVTVLEVRGYEQRFIDQGQWNDVREKGLGVEYVREVVSAGELLHLTGREAVAMGVADGLCADLGEVLDKLGLPRAEPTTVERKRSEDVAAFLFTYGWLFLGLGFFFAWIEIKVPGFGVPGIASIVCFGIFLAGRYLVGLADVPNAVLLILGVVLVAVELFVLPGTLWPGILGAVAIFVGLAWTLLGPGFSFGDELAVRLFLDELTRLGLSAALALILALSLSRFLPRAPLFSRLVLDAGEPGSAAGGAMPEAHDAHAEAARVGARGRTLTPLRPVGKVALDEAPGLEFEARSSGPEVRGDVPVRVVEVQRSGRLVVEPDPA